MEYFLKKIVAGIKQARRSFDRRIYQSKQKSEDQLRDVNRK